MEEKNKNKLFIGISIILGAIILGGAIFFALKSPELPPPPPGGSTELLKIENPFDDDIVLGNKDAKVIVIEFSDFQCPFCRKFFNETLPQLEKDYITPGKIAFVYRDFPLDSIHPGARSYALAAECAKEQNKWRDMHDKIFEEQSKEGVGTVPYSEKNLKKWAKEIGLNMNKFNGCFDNNKYKDEIEKDFKDGISLGVSGTPTFFIGTKEKGFRRVVGAQPYSTIKQVIDSFLEK